MRRRINKKTRRRRKRPFVILVLLVVLAGVLTAGIVLYNKYRTFSGYTRNTVISMSNYEENTEYYPYNRGFLKCAGDGVTYFSEDGIIWNEYYSMLQPVIDICGDYIAVADMGQRNVYIYDNSGYVNRINISHGITDVEISKAGVICVASNDDNVNYIEVRDRNGNEIMTEKSVFSSKGFLMDIAMSEDGSRLAGVFVSIEKGTLKSKVVFYDLSGDGSEDVRAAVFDDYGSVMLTTVRFMDKDTVCAVGDAAITIFKFDDVPEVIWDLRDMGWEIQSLFFCDEYIGLLTEENESENRYSIKVIDLSGNILLEQGTDFSYSKIDFAGANVVLYSYNECVMYSLAGIEKLYCSFDSHIEALKSKDGRHFVYGTNSNTEFITIR